MPNSARCLDLTYIGKGANHRSDLKRLPQTLLLSRDWPNNDDEYLFLLSKTKHLFTYDPVSQVIHDAIAMGARPVLMTKSPLSSAQFVEMQGRLQGLISVHEESDHSDGKAFEQSRLDWLGGLQPLGTYNAPLEECVASMVSFFS